MGEEVEGHGWWGSRGGSWWGAERERRLTTTWAAFAQEAEGGEGREGALRLRVCGGGRRRWVAAASKVKEKEEAKDFSLHQSARPSHGNDDSAYAPPKQKQGGERLSLTNDKPHT